MCENTFATGEHAFAVGGVGSSQASRTELDESADTENEELENSMQEEEEGIAEVQAAETQVCYHFIAFILNHSDGSRL